MIATKFLKPLAIVAVAIIALGATVEAAPAKGERCIQCFAPPMCPPCASNEECVIIPATCNDCGSGFCKKVETIAVKEEGEKCIKCFAPPMCPPCGADEECVLVPATCNDCGSGFCKKKEPLAPKVAPKNTKGCIKCFAPPMCPPCEADEECVLVPATCNDCGSGFCKKKEPLVPKVADAKKVKGCIKCFAPPMCPPCEADEECVLVPATCNDCGSGFCKKKQPLAPKAASKNAKGKTCVQCFAAPSCPPCAKDEKCVIIPATCDDCGSGHCEKL